jgi:hypothetical protein
MTNGLPYAALRDDKEAIPTMSSYFACSPLGRAVAPHTDQPFQGYGVLEPLVWILTGRREDGSGADPLASPLL